MMHHKVLFEMARHISFNLDGDRGTSPSSFGACIVRAQMRGFYGLAFFFSTSRKHSYACHQWPLPSLQ